MVDKTVLVSNTKGGTGKTFLSILTAYRLAEEGYSVGICDVDLDSLPSYSSMMFKIDGEIYFESFEDMFDMVEGETETKYVNVPGKRARVYKYPDDLQVFRGYTKENSNNWEDVKVLMKHKYSGPVRQVNTRAGCVTVSPNHPMLIKPRAMVKQAKEIEEGMKLIHPDIGNDYMDGYDGTENMFIGGESLARLYGLLVGDGSVFSSEYTNGQGNRGNTYSVTFSNTKKELINEVSELFEDLFSVNTWIVEDKQDNDRNTIYTVRTENKELYGYLRDILYTSGGKKKVPKLVLNAPDDTKKAFLGGYHEADGCHDAPEVKSFERFSTDSEVLCSGLVWLYRTVYGKSFTVHTRPDKPNVYSATINNGSRWTEDRSEIKDIRDKHYDGWLYDLKTEDTGTFSAGVGGIRIHNSPNLGNILGITKDMDVEGITADGQFEPIEIDDNIQVISMAMYVEEDKGVRIGSGDRSQVIYDISTSTDWDPDVYIVDLPAGSGEIFNQVARMYKETLVGVMVVSQSNQKYDSMRTLNLCEDEGAPVMGVVENMSGVICPECNHHFVTTSVGEIEEICMENDVTFLGSIREYDNVDERMQDLDFGEDVDRVLDGFMDRFESMDVGVSFIDKVKDKAKKGGRKLASKVVSNMIKYTKGSDVVGKLREQYNFTDEQVVFMDIVSESREDNYLQDLFVLRSEGFKVVRKEGIEPDLYVELTMEAIARMIWTDSSPLDEWAKGRVKFRGEGSTQKGIKFLDHALSDMLSGIRETKSAKILKRLI